MSQAKYKYFTNGTVPVRATMDAQDEIESTEIPDHASRALKTDFYFVGRIEWSTDYYKIDEAEFSRMCEEFYNGPPPRKLELA